MEERRGKTSQLYRQLQQLDVFGRTLTVAFVSVSLRDHPIPLPLSFIDNLEAVEKIREFCSAATAKSAQDHNKHYSRIIGRRHIL